MSNEKLKLEMQDANALAAGYHSWWRYVEIGSIFAFFMLIALIVRRSWQVSEGRGFLIASAFMSGYVMADFISGFVHWMADTWGSTKLKIIGPGLIRPFREHHVDPKAMTRHDVIETNGNNCLISLWVGAICVFMPLESDGALSPVRIFLMVSLGSMIFWVMMTNQFHKWSHLEGNELPGLVRFLQRVHLILPPQHHDVHHTAPFDKYYCITTGWLNWPLTKLGFFKGLERLVTMMTGLVPRADDIGLDAALKVAPPPTDAQPEPKHAQS
ncbi:MAG: fatty acid desaturase family protein [Myxococcaceae bacterium]|nr:fatty acid desaturase family protein [Myxococcaceae bacterium]